MIAERIEPLPEDEHDDRGNVIKTWEYDKDKKPISIEVEPPKPSVAEDIEYFYKRMRFARAFVEDRELAGEVVDFVSTRAIKDGCKAIAYGIHYEEILEAVTKTWPEDSKNELKNWTTDWKPKLNTAIDVSRYELLET